MPEERIQMNVPDYHSLYEKLGDMQATLRVVKHETANTSTKLDALAHLVATQGHLATDVELLKKQVHELEVEKHRREGAIGLVEWISKHWPFALLGLLIIAASALFNGKLG